MAARRRARRRAIPPSACQLEPRLPLKETGAKHSSVAARRGRLRRGTTASQRRKDKCLFVCFLKFLSHFTCNFQKKTRVRRSAATPTRGRQRGREARRALCRSQGRNNRRDVPILALVSRSRIDQMFPRDCAAMRRCSQLLLEPTGIINRSANKAPGSFAASRLEEKNEIAALAFS